ncbi:MAG: hypothetical protein ACREBS_04610 [Nitrososphaerales archaeon]
MAVVNILTKPKDSSEKIGIDDDPMFSGRGSPALMSMKEPSLRLLRERYVESFAITTGSENRVHLFLVKIGLWSLVWTFTTKHSPVPTSLDSVLKAIEDALSGRDPELLEKLDKSVSDARTRIRNKAQEFGSQGKG